MFINSYGSCLRIDWKVLHFCRKSLTQAVVLYINILMVTMWYVSMPHVKWHEPDKLAEIEYEAVSRTKQRFLVQSNSCICMEMQQKQIHDEIHAKKTSFHDEIYTRKHHYEFAFLFALQVQRFDYAMNLFFPWHFSIHTWPSSHQFLGCTPAYMWHEPTGNVSR